jgi:hypothetical protein
MSTLEETLRVLGSHSLARHSYHVRAYHSRELGYSFWVYDQSSL